MVLLYFLFFLLVLAISLVLFFMFTILYSALRRQGFPVDFPLFSDKELHYFVREEAEPQRSSRRAVALCSADKTFDGQRLRPLRGQTCALINEVYGSLNDCKFSCIGLGDCCAACPQEAIVIENGCAVVTSMCIGCGNCVRACPKNIFALFERTDTEAVLCVANSGCLTTCSECEKQKKIPIKQKRHFKFWQSCYRMLCK